MILAFDTETTGKARFDLPALDAKQPHLVQLGAILVDDEFTVRGEINLIIRPDGWTIPDEASSIHGITQDVAERFGVDKSVALTSFIALSKMAKIFVCHNFDFDYLIMSSFDARISDVALRFSHMRDGAFCTMKAMTPVCKIPGNYGDYKWPKLTEAYRHAFGEAFDGAHDAMADVRACLRVYKWLTTQPKI